MHTFLLMTAYLLWWYLDFSDPQLAVPAQTYLPTVWYWIRIIKKSHQLCWKDNSCTHMCPQQEASPPASWWKQHLSEVLAKTVWITESRLTWSRTTSLYTPSQRGTALSHTTLPSLRMQEMVCEPWVLTKPSSHRNEMELPSWRLSPNRFPFTGTPGSGHSLWRNAIEIAERRYG